MKDEAEQEFILFPSTDDDISTQGDGPLKKPLDIFTLFSDLNNPSNLAKELRQYGILKEGYKNQSYGIFERVFHEFDIIFTFCAMLAKKLSIFPRIKIQNLLKARYVIHADFSINFRLDKMQYAILFLPYAENLFAP